MNFLLLLWWPRLQFSVLLCRVVDTVNELEVVDCAHELDFHSFYLYFMPKLPCLVAERDPLWIWTLVIIIYTITREERSFMCGWQKFVY